MPLPSKPPLATRAPAKINLDLIVRGRRADGYHELRSLVAFAGAGDSLSLRPGDGPPSLTASGPFAAGLPLGDDTLILRAAAALAAARPGLRAGAFHLVKRLPLASGIGGGSADAAAALRLLARLNDIAPDDPLLHEVARQIGADVPVCLAGRARLMEGVGERLGPPLRLPPLFAVLANPGEPVPTAAVFRALGLAPGAACDGGTGAPASGAAMDAAELVAALAASRNDLEAPAQAVAPVVGEALAALAALPGCRLARMSGSGATCFGLFDDCRASAAAARVLARVRPGWWLKATVIR